MTIRVLITPKQPWIHAIYQQDGIHDPNKTLCGIQRGIRNQFFEGDTEYIDVSENPYQYENMCGVCWWIYRKGEQG